MADTSAQKLAELWIVQHFIPQNFNNISFHEKKVPLIWGGSFSFDAVSEDGSIIGLVSTSSAITSGGNLASAKIQKLKCDALYLTNIASPCKKFLVFSEMSMLLYFKKEASKGRFPKEVELHHTDLPEHLNVKVLAARAKSQLEVSPSRSTNINKES